MTSRHRRRSWAVVLLVAILTALPAWVVQAGTTGSSASLAHRGDVARARTLAYWTPARMRAAVPRAPLLAGTSAVESGTRHLGIGFQPGDDWPNGLGRVYRATGKVFFRLDGSPFVCSGAVITDSSALTARSLVLTAAHCAYEFGTGFATDWMFVPQYDTAPSSCAQSAYGCWTASSLVVHTGFASASTFGIQAVRHDFAVAVVGAGDRGTQLDKTVGTFRLTTAGVTGEKRFLFGYPAAGQYANNTDLIYCSGRTFNDDRSSGLTWGVPCDMTGGASGGPWFSAFDVSTGYGRITSLNSYGYPDAPGNMFGPKFNQNTLDVYNAARTTNQNRIVP